MNVFFNFQSLNIDDGFVLMALISELLGDKGGPNFDKLRSFDAGCTERLIKPFNDNLVLKAINNI